MTIRVLIADDHPLVASALTSGMETHTIEVVATTSSPDEVLPKFEEARPDVVVLDVRFGRTATKTGLDVARELLRQHADARIVFYSQFDADEMIMEAYRLGAGAFLPKSTPLETVAEAIAKVHAKSTYFLPNVAERVALLGLRGTQSPQALLEPRELEVFRRMAKSRTNAEIAEELNLSVKTISTISQTVKDKLKVQRPGELTALAIRYELITP